MTRVHVLGAAGYAAAEFIRYAQRHPQLELGVLESASHAGSPLADSIPALRASERTFDASGTLEACLESEDLVVLAGERDAAREQAPKLLARGARVIDFSDAFRLAPTSHGAVYGWTERYENALAGARFVANPGCYPTATLLALAPLGAFGDDILQLIVDAKSGITGAGRKPRTELLFAEAAEDVRAYGLGGHRHEAEIEQELASLGITAPMVFTPHVVPLRRGMLSDCYAVFSREPNPAAIHAAFARGYDGNPFVRVLPADRAPSLVAVAGTVDAEVHVTVAGRVVRAIAAIDNLGKGAAGQALQSVNLMLGYSKEYALDDRGARV